MDIELEICQIYILAYRREMKVKEFRQSVMLVAREHKDRMLRTAMIQALTHMSNAQLTEVMESTGRAKMELQRRQLMALPDDPAELFQNKD